MISLKANNIDIRESADKLKHKVSNWKGITLDIVKDLYDANKYYSNSGYRKDLLPHGSRLYTFKDYFKYVGLYETTVYRWLERYEPDKNKLLSLSELKAKKEIEYKEKISNVKKKIRNYGDDKKWNEIKDKAFEGTKKESVSSKYDKEFLDELLKHAKEETKAKENFRGKLSQANNKQNPFFDVLDDYLLNLKDDTEKLEALHNIIKYCKQHVNKYQAKSVGAIKPVFKNKEAQAFADQ